MGSAVATGDLLRWGASLWLHNLSGARTGSARRGARPISETRFWPDFFVFPHFLTLYLLSGALLGSVDTHSISLIRFWALELLILAPFQDSQIQAFCWSLFFLNSVSGNSVL